MENDALRRLFLVTFLALPSLARAAGHGGTPVGGACSDDRQCAVGAICTDRVCAALPKGTRIIPFYWHQPGAVGHRYIVPLLYFSEWSRSGEARVQVPFYVGTSDAEAHSRTTVVPPLLFSRHTTPSEDAFRIWPLWFYTRYPGQGAQAALLPLFWWSHRAATRWFVAPLLLSGGQRNDRDDITEAVIGLIGYYRRHRDDTWRIVAPLFFDHETATTRTTVAPLAYFHREGGHRAGVLFPLYWHSSDEALGRSHTLLLPLFDHESERHGRFSRTVALVGGYERDDDAGTSQLLLLAPPLFHRRDRRRTVDVALPLYTHWRVHGDGSAGFIAGPLWVSRDPDGESGGLVPVYWRFKDNKTGAETQLVPPIAAWHHHPGARGGYLGPVYGWSSSNGAGGWGAGVAPILFFGRNGTRHHALVLPVFARWGDRADGSSTTALGPIFFHREPGGWDAGLFPLVFAGHHRDRGYTVVPPIFLHRSNRDGALDVLGPAYLYRGRQEWAFGLAPLAFFGRLDGRTHQVVLPLFYRFTDERAGTERLLFGPYYHGRDGARVVDVLFPLFYLRRAPSDGLLLSPLVAWRKERARETLVVGPYVHRTDAASGASTHLLFPLGLVHRAPGYQVTVQFPFFWRIHEGDETDTAIFPFYWRVRSPRLSLDGLFPLALSIRTPVARTLLLGPLWYRARRDGGRSFVLFPLVGWGRVVDGKDGKRSSWLGAPGIYWAHNEHTGATDAVVGPFFDIIRPDGYTAGVPPLVFAWRRGTTHKLLLPLFYQMSDAAADRSLTVFGPLYFGHDAETHRLGLVPLLFARWGGAGSSTFLLPLFYASHKKDGAQVIATPLFGWSSYASGRRAYVGPFYWRHDAEVSSAAVWPLFYHTRNLVTGSRTSFLLPLFLDTRASDGRQLAAYTPLVWRYHSVETTILVGLPLFFDVNRFGESRTTGLLPLLVRNHDQARKVSTWVAPPLLLWARHRESATDLVWFPLVWHYGGRDSSTVVAPLFWDFSRGPSRTTVLFPLLVHWRRSDARRTLVLNFYYSEGVGSAAGSWYANIIPLVSFGRPRPRDLEWDFLFGLFGYARQGRNRTLKLFWFPIPLEPTPSTISWFGSTPPGARTEF
jgi:hypothetical protein